MSQKISRYCKKRGEMTPKCKKNKLTVRCESVRQEKHKENHGLRAGYESTAEIFKQFIRLPYDIWKESKLLFGFCTMCAVFIGSIPLMPKNENSIQEISVEEIANQKAPSFHESHTQNKISR